MISGTPKHISERIPREMPRKILENENLGATCERIIGGISDRILWRALQNKILKIAEEFLDIGWQGSIRVGITEGILEWIIRRTLRRIARDIPGEMPDKILGFLEQFLNKFQKGFLNEFLDELPHKSMKELVHSWYKKSWKELGQICGGISIRILEGTRERNLEDILGLIRDLIPGRVLGGILKQSPVIISEQLPGRIYVQLP